MRKEDFEECPECFKDNTAIIFFNPIIKKDTIKNAKKLIKDLKQARIAFFSHKT